MKARLAVIIGVVVLAVGATFGIMASTSSAGAATSLSFVVHGTNVVFATAHGTTLTPTGPLVPGDRIVIRDDLLQGGKVIGFGNGYCTVTFNDNAMCQLIVSITNKGDAFVTFLQRGGAKPPGPAVYDGIITGGTFAYSGARGSFHAVVLPTGDDMVTATLQ